jgi:hypothetical protein
LEHRDTLGRLALLTRVLSQDSDASFAGLAISSTGCEPIGSWVFTDGLFRIVDTAKTRYYPMKEVGFASSLPVLVASFY